MTGSGCARQVLTLSPSNPKRTVDVVLYHRQNLGEVHGVQSLRGKPLDVSHERRLRSRDERATRRCVFAEAIGQLHLPEVQCCEKEQAEGS